MLVRVTNKQHAITQSFETIVLHEDLIELADEGNAVNAVLMKRGTQMLIISGDINLVQLDLQ